MYNYANVHNQSYFHPFWFRLLLHELYQAPTPRNNKNPYVSSTKCKSRNVAEAEIVGNVRAKYLSYYMVVFVVYTKLDGYGEWPPAFYTRSKAKLRHLYEKRVVY